MVLAIVFAALLGAVIGSFLTVVVHRVPDRESIVSPGSACPACGTPVPWYRNVPIASWLIQRGRCAACGAHISARYPALEAGTALVFAAIVAVRGVEPELALALPGAAVLIAVAVIDAEREVIPDPIVLTGVVLAVVAGVAADLDGMPERLIAGAAAFAVFLVIAMVSPKGMGLGDVKLAGAMGLFLGIEVIPALFVAFLSGSLVGLVVIALGGIDKRKSRIPFGPFLALGGIVAFIAGGDLVDLYRHHFL